MAFRLSSRMCLLLCFVVTCSALRLKSQESSGDDHNTRPLLWRSKWEYVKSLSLPGSSSLWGVSEELKSCEQVYGIFPCSTTIGGNLLLLMVYGYMLLKAAQFLSDGSELLLLVLNPGIVGGLLLPILGAVPDSLLILVSGMSASAAAAQSEVLVGMGLLAGSNIILLTVIWGGSLILGCCDLISRGTNRVAKDKTLTNGFNLSETGVTTDQQTRVASWIMMITVIPYLVAQTPWMFGWSKNVGHKFVLVGCVICLTFLAIYCFYQVAFPWFQEMQIERATVSARRASMLHKLDQYTANRSWGGLLGRDNQPNKETIERLFTHFDNNGDNHLSKEELKGLITVLGFEKGLDTEVSSWIQDFDLSNDQKISQHEFVTGMVKWMTSSTKSKNIPKRTSNGNDDTKPHPFWRTHSLDARRSLTALTQDQVDAEEEEELENRLTKGQVITKAVLLLVTGLLIAGISADPLVTGINNFSTVTGISPFFISFVATPLATSSSDAFLSLTFARKKKKKNISMTYSQIYGSVTMNNTVCLAVFLAIVYARGLTWDFSSEVLVILVATVVIGALASFRVTFPLWMAIVALLLYPFSITLVAVLDNGLGWQ